MRELNELAAQYGFGPAELTRGSNHLQFKHLTTGKVVFFSGTSSDANGVRRLITKFKRAAGLLPTPDERNR